VPHRRNITKLVIDGHLFLKLQVGGHGLTPLADDRFLLPSLLVAIYSPSGKLIDIEAIPDRRG
jgi:hypothetical protein